MLGILARLAAGTTNYVDAGRGGASVLTKTEVAGLFSGLNPAAVDFALAKYCDDGHAFLAIQLQLMALAAQRSVSYAWKTSKGKPIIMSLGALAVIESINPRLCFSCNSPLILGIKDCSCGKPRTGICHADRYRYMDLCKGSWDAIWRDRYEYFFDYCQMLDAEVSRVVRLNNRVGECA